MPTALQQFLAKFTVPSWARTAEWREVPAMLRLRAFFSAGIENARVLTEARNAVAGLLQSTSKDGKLYRRDTAITELQELMRRHGLDTGHPDAITNPASESRIALIIDTNRAQAQGYARFKRSSTGGALLAFPAQELIRVEDRRVPRNWESRWIAAGGTLYEGRMIALKTDPIWYNEIINRFGNPYPPFDFNSGMGVRNVSRRTAIAIGLITEDWQPESDPVDDFNARTEASVKNVDPGLLQQLQQAFGGRITVSDGRARLNVNP